MTRAVFDKAEQAESRQFIANALECATKDRRGRPVINDGELVNLSWHYDRAHGRMADKDKTGRWANKVRGAGMDLGFHLAWNIAGLVGLAGDYCPFRQEWV